MKTYVDPATGTELTTREWAKKLNVSKNAFRKKIRYYDGDIAKVLATFDNVDTEPKVEPKVITKTKTRIKVITNEKVIVKRSPRLKTKAEWLEYIELYSDTENELCIYKKGELFGPLQINHRYHKNIYNVSCIDCGSSYLTHVDDLRWHHCMVCEAGRHHGIRKI